MTHPTRNVLCRHRIVLPTKNHTTKRSNKHSPKPTQPRRVSTQWVKAIRSSAPVRGTTRPSIPTSLHRLEEVYPNFSSYRDRPQFTSRHFGQAQVAINHTNFEVGGGGLTPIKTYALRKCSMFIVVFDPHRMSRESWSADVSVQQRSFLFTSDMKKGENNECLP